VLGKFDPVARPPLPGGVRDDMRTKATHEVVLLLTLRTGTVRSSWVDSGNKSSWGPRTPNVDAANGACAGNGAACLGVVELGHGTAEDSSSEDTWSTLRRESTGSSLIIEGDIEHKHSRTRYTRGDCERTTTLAIIDLGAR
jgi:hypothetical protein